MLHFIKNPEGKPAKYLGMLGSHLIEILDNDPYLLRVLKSKRAKGIYRTSVKSRFMGDHQRMVLMAKNDDGLFALRRLKSPNGIHRIELSILHISKESFSIMLKEVAVLARMRWPKLRLFIQLSSHEDIANLKIVLLNLDWIADEDKSIMEYSLSKGYEGHP